MRLLASSFLLAFSSLVAGSTDTMVVNVEVQIVNELSVDVTDIPLFTIISIPAGQFFASASDSSSTYTFETSEDNKKITAVMDAEMPLLTTLEIELDAEAGKGTSTGTQTLSTFAVDCVTGIDRSTLSTGQTITYTFTVTLGADPFELITRTVTLSLIDE